MKSTFDSVMIYSKDMDKSAEFYSRHFGLIVKKEDGLIALCSSDGKEKIVIHKAGSAVKMGQACVKLMFRVSNVEKFKEKALKSGLKFGSTHKNGNYQFANTKDPDKNNICITSRKQPK